MKYHLFAALGCLIIVTAISCVRSAESENQTVTSQDGSGNAVSSGILPDTTRTSSIFVPTVSVTPTTVRNEATQIDPRQHAVNESDAAPVLFNLMLQDLGPWDAANARFGTIKYDQRMRNQIFDEFGFLHNEGQPSQYHNPTFEFKAPADSILVAPISGVVTYLEWQPSTHYAQDDWEIIIAPSPHSKWGVSIDHITSIDCNRAKTGFSSCNSQLTIDGITIDIGTFIEVGQILGYIGNWPSDGGSGINGRTELTVFRYFDDYSGVTNYCPIDYLDKSVRDTLKNTIHELMSSYELWVDDKSIYYEDEMISPGCRYSAIIEKDGVTTPVKE